jgi:hypothetical protein
MKTGRQLLWNSGFYNFLIFSSVAFYWRFFYQVVNLKEAREFSSNKKFIYVFKVIYPPSLVLICVSKFLFHIITFLFLLVSLINNYFLFSVMWIMLLCALPHINSDFFVLSRNWNGNLCLLIFCRIQTCSQMLKRDQTWGMMMAQKEFSLEESVL